MRLATPICWGGKAGCSSRRKEGQYSRQSNISPLTGARDVSARESHETRKAARYFRHDGIAGSAAGRDVPRSVHGHALTMILLSTLAALSASADVSQRECEARARQEYSRPGVAHTNQIKDVKTAWEFARACFDVGEFATNSNERAEIAEQGISLC